MGAPLVEVRDLNVRFPVRKGVFARIAGWTEAVRGVSLCIERNETLGIVGESGSGKSTLARAILGLVRPSSGSILLDGRDMALARGRERAAMRRRVQAVFQDPLASLNPRFTVLDILTEAPVYHGMFGYGERREKAIGLLEAVGMDASALGRYPHEFSGGQRQRISIARALALRPELLICDEAVSALDLSIRAQILELLESLKRRFGLSYLFITHDIGVVRRIADRVAVMQRGRIVESGPADRVLSSPEDPYTKGLLAAVPEIGRPLAADCAPDVTGVP